MASKLSHLSSSLGMLNPNPPIHHQRTFHSFLLLHPPLNYTNGILSSKTISITCRDKSSNLCHAVKEDQEIQTSDSTTPSSSKLVLVAGGTGGVGQLIVASLLSRNIKARLLLRDASKAKTLFGEQDENSLQVWEGDTRNHGDLDAAMFEGVTHAICCTGTTAFPSRRWDGDNTPKRVDWDGVRNLVSALPPTIKRLILCFISGSYKVQ